MTGIYSLAPVSSADATLTTINTNIDGLELAIGTQADTPNAAGSLLGRLAALAQYVDGLESALGTSADTASTTGTIAAKLAAIATFIDGLEGFTDGIEAVLGINSASPGANTINANIIRNIKASAQCSSTLTAPASATVPVSTNPTPVTIAAANASLDWRRVSIYNNGSVTIFIALGGNVTSSVYSFPLPAGYFVPIETVGLITAISSGAASTCLVTVES